MIKPSTTMRLCDFDYALDDNLIARTPLDVRSASRLLHIKNSIWTDERFENLANLLAPNDLLVFNDTKVMNARLFGQKQSGGQIEVLVERVLDAHTALCFVRASRAPKPEQLLRIHDGKDHTNGVDACVKQRVDNLFVLEFSSDVHTVLNRFGQLPIPPYFERKACDMDDRRYQSVFCDDNKKASVAAPTASLHFDEALLHHLAQKGIKHTFVTLHVGAGTFTPVKTDDILQHKMHKEYAILPKHSADAINSVRKNGGKIVAVGTTATRVLETAHWHAKHQGKNELDGWQGDTDIFIYPPYQFGVVDKLITNFHLPKSTLLMLVAAFCGKDMIMNAYQHAINKRYRFFSYGDAMLIERDAPSSKVC